MGSASGVRKQAAKRIGVSLAEYDARLIAGQKWCGRCRRWHARRLFGADSSRSDGLATTCRVSRVQPSDGPGKAERGRSARRGDSWCRQCTAWVPTTEVRGGLCRDHRNADYRTRYAVDGEAIRQRVYARKRSLEPIPAWWVAEKREEFNGLCAYGCGRPATSNDHIWPVALGGTSRADNIVPACLSCNSSKNDSLPGSWVLRGLEAFPDQWLNKIALALQFDADTWVDDLNRLYDAAEAS